MVWYAKTVDINLSLENFLSKVFVHRWALEQWSDDDDDQSDDFITL